MVSLAPSHPLLATGKVTQVGPFCSPLLDKMVTCKGLLPHKSNMEPEIHPIDRRKKSSSKLPFWDSMLVFQGIIEEEFGTIHQSVSPITMCCNSKLWLS